ncbi:MAG TPA: isoleucine--tRNA ligase, partial [Candidatus Thermoplasmatota archaeon]|nr:isoleucine--tRNA ligase [Candidatus Thermoplasmatota archaeon]
MVRAAERTYDARALESRIAAYWEKTDAYAETKRHRAHGKPYYFLDGPPYATGHIHIGTARNKVLKDVFVRHMRQRGWNVRDQPGYDMHGLPIEVKVEKELGIRSKKDIEAHGIDRFVEACRTFAVDHLRMMNDEFRELGVWLDWDKPYMTITNEYVEGAWWAIEKAHERGLLFESERVLTWCWRCETALANAEVEHEEREDPSAYVKFPVEGREGDFLVIWTTTPWTLPANVAIAANPETTYARVRCRKDGREETLIVAAAQAEGVARIGRYESFEVLSTFQGREMEGLRYVHPFRGEVPYHARPASEWNNRVILGDHVATDRSGLVHTATGHGVEDFEVGRKYGIPVFSPVGEDGRYTHEAGAFAGLAVKTEAGSPADDAVLAKLRERGLLLASRMEKHAYGHCWRCKNPLVFRATKQWFIDVPKVKDRMVEEVKRVEWTPDWAGSHRQLDWVQNARDWCISRQRYWGIPLPVWTCQHCSAVTVVGSRRELHHVSDYKHGDDLHRPWIDRVRVACPTRGCGGIMKRVPDVLDVWFDSAVAAWASLAYPSHRKDFDHLFPARWICEGLDQTRGWFYSQLAAGVAAMDRVPYEKVVMHGWVNDAHGRPMSKSLGNIVKPGDVVAKFGCDAFRLGLVGGAAPWDDVSFGEESVRGSSRTLNILWNVHVFATQYMHTDGYRHDPARLHAVQRPEDKWLLSRLQSTIADATRFVEANEFHRAIRTTEQFVLEDLSRWYVRLVRDRVWDEAPSDDKTDAFAVLHEALHASARLLAPFAPHVAEAVYQDLTEGHELLSVHMTDWPVADAALTDFDLERDMATVRAAVDAAAHARQKANMKLRWPVAKLVFASDDPDVRTALTRFRPLLLEQANAKDADLVSGEWERLDLALVPNKAVIGKTYRADGPRVLAALAQLSQAQLRDLRAKLARGETAPLDVGGMTVDLTRDVVAFETRLPANTSGADFPGGSVYVDTHVSPELQAEGAARDLTRRIQEMRKALGLAMGAAIRTQVQAPAELA